jgi:3-hydroxyisobutyrate dehydrogenase-like beta-hydroxyacid dehydrogenase
LNTIGIIGLGLLGSALADRWLRAGHVVLGYDISADTRQALARAGGRALDSADELAAECDTLVLSLPDSKIVATVIDALEATLRRGLLVIDTTTGDPADAEALGQRLAARRVAFIEATIAGSSAQVRQGEAIAMIGGDEPTLGGCKELLAAVAAQTFYLGPWGSASRMKLVVNLVLGLNRAVLAEGLTLAGALGLEVTRALEILRVGPAYSTVMDTKGPKMLAEDFQPEARLAQHAKDVRLILENAKRTGTALPLSQTHRALLELAEAAGYGPLDNSAILLAIRDLQ